ncbi:phosphatidate cytidylyltransferase, mitochondrial-like isoform X2 [Phlebotomus papatasi]|nr:phosphatidate cytidylyltransferase, mitochondrial-like isoform X2 [Phlebotomus papatasi]
MMEWHRKNIEKNPHDYSGLGIFGAWAITKYQISIPANVYCNTLIPVKDENVTIKYSVTRKSDLIEDATQWTYLYLSGRLHKPVQFIQEPDETLKKALDKNLETALTVALLLLPEKFSNLELFYTIAELSYSGDFRMIFGENPNKVNNIVKPQLESFFRLYKPLIEQRRLTLQYPHDFGGQYIQEKSREIVFEQLKSIPFIYPVDNLTNELKDYRVQLRHILRMRVFRSSALQSIKNIPTAGFIKSLKYSYAKALKTFKK